MAVTVLSMRHVRDHFIVTKPDIEPVKFKTRHEAREWCRQHFHGSPIREEGPGGKRRARRQRLTKTARATTGQANGLWIVIWPTEQRNISRINLPVETSIGRASSHGHSERVRVVREGKHACC
jgi:hypothetical protein